MPIKFRCVHCNKLLGIARRKAGTIVDCPQCKQQLIVPTPDDPEPEPEEDQVTVQPEPVKPPPKLFEQDNFEILLQEQDAPTYRSHEGAHYAPAPTFAAERNLPIPATVMSPPSGAAPAPLPLPYPTQHQQPQRAGGVVLSGGKIMLILVVMFFVVAGAFGAGIFVGKSLSSGG
jgi:hypothetical protein